MITLTSKKDGSKLHVKPESIAKLFINSEFSKRYQNCEFQELSHALHEFIKAEKGMNSICAPGTLRRNEPPFTIIEKIVFEKGIKLCNTLAEVN